MRVPGGVRAGMRGLVGRVVRGRGGAVGGGCASSSWRRAFARATVVWVFVALLHSFILAVSALPKHTLVGIRQTCGLYKDLWVATRTSGSRACSRREGGESFSVPHVHPDVESNDSLLLHPSPLAGDGGSLSFFPSCLSLRAPQRSRPTLNEKYADGTIRWQLAP